MDPVRSQIVHYEVQKGYESENLLENLTSLVFSSHNGRLTQTFSRLFNWAFNSSENKEQATSERELRFKAEVAKISYNVLMAMKNASSIDQLHYLFQEGIQQIEGLYATSTISKDHSEGINQVRIFLINQVGLYTIGLALPSSHLILRDIVKKFYLDETHPMDLQKLLKDRDQSPKVGHILRNLAVLNNRSSTTLRKIAIIQPQAFNSFLTTYVQGAIRILRSEQKQTNLLGIQTVEAQITLIRERQERYFNSFGVSKEMIEQELQFSTLEEKKGIYLSSREETPAFMREFHFFDDGQKIFLRVPDTSGRVVSISKTGFSILENLQKKTAQNMVRVMFKLNTLFKPLGHSVTGRTKSSQSILDKCGRLCEKTQGEKSEKYIAVTDIIDICGCRVTCSSSSEIFEVIQILEREGFEFLELDNKYNTIRKDGAYKVMPCTLRDPTTGLVFELQITTLTSITVTDLFHNVIYKKEAIGLRPTEKQEKMVLALQRLAALTETISLVGQEIFLARNLDEQEISLALNQLDWMIIVVGEYNNEFKRKTIGHLAKL